MALAQTVGLGLGLPSQRMHCSSGRSRTVSVSSLLSFGIDGDDSFEADCESLDFPMPPSSHEQSYWSPTTQGDSPRLSESGDASFIAHSALHLMSPKAQAMAGAAAAWGLGGAVDGAVDFGWLIPAIEEGEARPPTPTRRVPVRMNSVETIASPNSTAPSLHRAFSLMSELSASTQATSVHSSPSDRKSPTNGKTHAPLRYFSSVPDLQRPQSRKVPFDPSKPTLLAHTVAATSEDDPRTALLKIWLAAEAAEQARNRPLPALPVSSPLAADTKHNKVKHWLGRLTRTASKTSLSDDTTDAVREPRVRRARSIDQILNQAHN